MLLFCNLLFACLVLLPCLIEVESYYHKVMERYELQNMESEGLTCRWVNSKAGPGISPIEGCGLFAREDIPAGTEILIYGGRIVPKEEALSYREMNNGIGIQVKEGFYILPISPNSERLFSGVPNHSCDPNMGFFDTLVIGTIKDVKEGDELCYDYAFNETDMEDIACKCRKDNCRGIITDFDWTRDFIQEKHLEYFSPFLRNKILEGS